MQISFSSLFVYLFFLINEITTTYHSGGAREKFVGGIIKTIHKTKDRFVKTGGGIFRISQYFTWDFQNELEADAPLLLHVPPPLRTHICINYLINFTIIYDKIFGLILLLSMSFLYAGFFPQQFNKILKQERVKKKSLFSIFLTFN